MNMISQINAFENLNEYNEIGPGAQLLWYKLLRVANLSGWQKEVSISNTRLQSMTKSTEKTLINNRNQLIQCGLLTYKKRGRTKAGLYILTDLTTGNSPVKTTTGNIPVESKVVSTVNTTVVPPVDSTVVPPAYINKTKQNETKAKDDLDDPDVSQKELKDACANVYSMFEQEFGRPLSPLEFEKITGWLDADQYPHELLRCALQEAVAHQARSLSYIDRILLNWERSGIRTAEEARKNIRRRALKQAESQYTDADSDIPDIPLHNAFSGGNT